MADIKLKDLYGEEQSYSGVTELSVPKADGSGRTWYVERTGEDFVLQNTGYVLERGVFLYAVSAVGDAFGIAGEIDFTLATFDEEGGSVGNEHPVAVASVREEDGTYRVYLYVCETLTAAQLQQLGAVDEDMTGTATRGWNAKVEQEDGTVTVVHIDDPESVTVSIPLPITFYNDESKTAFYALLSPASQESTAVTLTENGTQTLTASAGKSGLRSVAVTVDVAGSGGLGAQADWAETDEGSAAYIKNKPEVVTAADVTAMLASAGVVEPAAVEGNKVLSDVNDDIYTF